MIQPNLLAENSPYSTLPARRLRYVEADGVSRPLLPGSLSDETVRTALAVWVHVSAAFRDNSPVGHMVSVNDALWAEGVLEQASVFQPDDLCRIVETTDFALGAYPLVAAAWGAEETEECFYDACLRDVVKNAPWVLLACLGTVALVSLVLAAFGGGVGK